MPSLRDLLIGDFGGGIGPGGGAISQFEQFGRGPEGSAFGGGQSTNPFAGLQQATQPMATAGMQSQNGAPTTTAPAGGLGGGGASALSTGAPIGTMAHAGGGGPFTFGFPFGVDEGGRGDEGLDPIDEGGGTSGEEAGGGAGGEDAGGGGDDEGGGGDDEGGGDDDGES